jgi:hypothetical protein
VAQRPTPLLILSVGLITLLLTAVGCERKLPAPWNEMQFPVRKGEILPGTDQSSMQVLYRGISAHAALFREYSSSLERAGYAHETDGKAHDPSYSVYSAFFKKGTERIKLHIEGAKDITVKVSKLD